MRIPSQFNEDNLYRRGSQRPKSADSVRHVIRMCVVLVLVIFVMKQAGQPRIYEIFFGEQGETAAPASPLGQAFAAALMTTQQQRFADQETSETTRAVADALTRSMSVNEQRQWTAILSRWNSGTPFHLVGAVVQQTQSLLQDLTDVDDDERRVWQAMLTRFGELYVDSDLVDGGELPSKRGLVDLPSAADETGADETAADETAADETAADETAADETAADETAADETAADETAADETGADETGADETGADQPAADQAAEEELLTDDAALRLVAWLNSLDRAALDRVVDGSVWRAADFDAFYLQLDQAPALTRQGALAIAVVPLLQQPKVYQGQLVRVSGLIAKAEKMDATANPFSIDHYWQLWIKPDTGSDRPLVVIVPNLTLPLARVVQSGGHPRARFVGRFFKRLAYRSQLGADLAPVVIGRVDVPEQIPVARNAASDQQTMSEGRRFLLTALVAAIIGVTIAAVAMWRSSVSGRRHRELRARRQQPKFPNQLERHDSGSQTEQHHE